MKTEKDIKRRIKILIQRHLDKFYKKFLKVQPTNCVHYIEFETKNDEFTKTGKNGERKIVIQNETIGLCHKNFPCKNKSYDQEAGEMHICHLEEDAQACFNGAYKDRVFTPKFSKKELKDSFFKLLNNKDKLKKVYPDVYNLEWAMLGQVSNWERFKGWIKEKVFLMK